MNVISILIKTDRFVISKTKSNININTNQVSDYTLFYTLEYINKNKKIVSEVLSNKRINISVFKDLQVFNYIYPLINSEKVIFDIDKSLTQNVMDTLFQNKKLKKVECFFMPSDYVHIAAQRNISVKFRNNMIFSVSFINDNEFKNMRSIYYKKVVNFYSIEDIEDNLENFLKVNSNLEVINMYCYSNDILNYVIKKLNETNHSDVDILIHQNDYNSEIISKNIEFLKKVNKKYVNTKSSREIKIIYSNSYFKDNIFKQLTLNGVKIVMVSLLYIGVVFIVSNRYHEYVALVNLRLLESTLASNLENFEIDEIDDVDIVPPEEPDIVVEEPSVEEPPVEEVPQEVEYVNYYASVQEATYEKLLSINPDVKGWLKVNNTKINYPITQSYDNTYYLEHDIYQNEITTGWVYMDYRNNATQLDDNTIIYGHNLRTGYMFGTLKNALEYDWYMNPQNQIITFNTLNRDMKWRIFSVYRTDYTIDYLETNFYTEDEFNNFVSMIKGRSIYDFGIDVKPGDKILTLSTCTGSNRRLAIHAVLIG